MDAAVRDMVLEMLDVRELALRGDDSDRELATEVKHQKYNQTVELDVMQRKLCLHEAQLKKLEEQIHANDQKHQMTYKKLLDSIDVFNVARTRILGMFQQNLKDGQWPSKSPADHPGVQESSATFIQDQPTRVERRCGAFVEGSHLRSPSPLKILPMETDQTSVEPRRLVCKRVKPLGHCHNNRRLH